MTHSHLCCSRWSILDVCQLHAKHPGCDLAESLNFESLLPANPQAACNNPPTQLSTIGRCSSRTAPTQRTILSDISLGKSCKRGCRRSHRRMRTRTPALVLWSMFLFLLPPTPPTPLPHRIRLSWLSLLSSLSSCLVAVDAVSPTWRAFHGAAIVDTSMVVFGGTTDVTEDPYGTSVPGSNDLWVWSTTLRQWSQPTTTFPGTASSAPLPQKFLSSISSLSQGKILSLISNTSGPATELLMLDTYFWVWSTPNPRKFRCW